MPGVPGDSFVPAAAPVLSLDLSRGQVLADPQEPAAIPGGHLEGAVVRAVLGQLHGRTSWDAPAGQQLCYRLAQLRQVVHPLILPRRADFGQLSEAV
jgi:hypothetical protein